MFQGLQRPAPISQQHLIGQLPIHQLARATHQRLDQFDSDVAGRHRRGGKLVQLVSQPPHVLAHQLDNQLQDFRIGFGAQGLQMRSGPGLKLSVVQRRKFKSAQLH